MRIIVFLDWMELRKIEGKQFTGYELSAEPGGEEESGALLIAAGGMTVERDDLVWKSLVASIVGDLTISSAGELFALQRANTYLTAWLTSSNVISLTGPVRFCTSFTYWESLA